LEKVGFVTRLKSNAEYFVMKNPAEKPTRTDPKGVISQPFLP